MLIHALAGAPPEVSTNRVGDECSFSSVEFRARRRFSTRWLRPGVGAATLVLLAASRGPAQSLRAPSIRPLTVRQIVDLRRPLSVQVSPDGRQIAFAVTQADLTLNRDHATLYVISALRKEAPRAVAEAVHITAVHWTPDQDRIFYVAETQSGRQIWSVRAEGAHRPQVVTHVSGRIPLFWEPTFVDSYSPYEISHDGSRLIYAAYDTTQARREQQTEIRGGVVYTGGWVKALTDPESRTVPFELYAQDLKSGEARKIWSTSAFSSTGTANPQFRLSPDGRTVGLLYQTAIGPKSRATLATLDIAGGAFHPWVTTLSWGFGLTWAADGRSLTFFSPGPVADSLAPHRPLAAYAFHFADTLLKRERELDIDDPDVMALSLATSEAGAHVARAVEAQGGPRLLACTVDRGASRAACVREAPTTPPEVVAVELRHGDPIGAVRNVTRLNQGYDSITLGKVSELKWHNRTVPGTAGLILPVGYDSGRRYPVLVMLYNLFSGRRFIADAEGFTSYPAQAFAGHGYAVVLMNSPDDRYDHAPGDFCTAKALEADGMAEAVRAAIDTLIARQIADSTRMGIMGWSWGGFWAPYIIMQHPTWFRAAAEGEGGNHYPGAYWWSGDEWRQQEDNFFGGGPYGRYLERWQAVSPVLMAGQMRAPLLMEHSTGYLAGLELRSAILAAGGQTELVLYPDDDHVFFLPVNRYNSMTRHFDWFNFWLLGEEDKHPAKADQYVRWRAMRSALAAREDRAGPASGTDSNTPSAACSAGSGPRH